LFVVLFAPLEMSGVEIPRRNFNGVNVI